MSPRKRRRRGRLPSGRVLAIVVGVACLFGVLWGLDSLLEPDDTGPSAERRAKMVRTCVDAGMEQYERRDTDPYLERQSRSDVEKFWKRACAELDKRGQLDQGKDGAPAGELRKTAGEVLQGMIDRGELPRP